MARLVIEPVRKTPDFDAAVRELYRHAQRNHLQVIPVGKADGAAHYQLRNPRTGEIQGQASIYEGTV